MVKLTEDMVVARSKGSELHNIKKLNCWGSELSDISVVRNLPNVEVLSLSVNQISTLEDFQYCTNLQELYIRKNNITDINEVLYLRQIPKLRSLWLADNPCADFPEYQMTVLRALPHLQKLDNVNVEPEDVQKAMVCGLTLPISSSREVARTESQMSQLNLESPHSEPQMVAAPQGYQARQINGTSQVLDEVREFAPTSRAVYDEDDEQPPMRQSNAISHVDIQQDYAERKRSSHAYSPQTSPRRPSQGHISSAETESVEVRPYSRSSDYVYESQGNLSYSGRDEALTSSRKSSRELQYREHSWTGDSDGYMRDRSYGRPQEYRTSSGEGRHYPPPRPLSDSVHHYDTNYRRSDHLQQQHYETTASRVASLDRPSPQRPYPLRPKTRNANVLSAVLCLIKELEYSSLEVVEMAIRCRMDELDD